MSEPLQAITCVATMLADQAEEILLQHSTSRTRQERQLLICQELLKYFTESGFKGGIVDRFVRILKTYPKPS